MKHLQCLVLFWFIPVFGFSQIIEINNSVHSQSEYNPEKLVKDILISSNCANVSNFSSQVKGNHSELSTKSYGYFKTPDGSDFPFKEGVVLTTGIAQPAGNEYNTERIDNQNNLSGDSDLETALGISDTYDATYFKFNFIPQVNEISFRYLMASEEYDGQTECQYADSFAFLLKEIGTENYINLAVLPDQTPVSVTNINDSNDCRQNVGYFEGYNPNTTNYGGHTKVLTAKSEVKPGTTYEIKLVVADQGDQEWDSAIFLEAGSFDLGGDLGEDRTIENGNPGCVGTPIILDTKLMSSELIFKWYRNETLISDANSSTLEVNTSGTYKFVAESGNCRTSDEVVIEFAESPKISAPPEDLFICETDGDLRETFDFSENEKKVLGTQGHSDFVFSYHANQSDAIQFQNLLSIPYTNTQQQETIWMRIANQAQTCFKIISFKIEVQSQPVAHLPKSYELCDDSTDGDDTNGVSSFDLTTKVSEVLGSQDPTQFEIKFYNSQDHADSGTSDGILNSTIKNTSNPQTVYVRVENKQKTDCYATTTIELKVNPLPQITSAVTLKQCDTDSDGITSFNLAQANSLISSEDENYSFTFHKTEADAISNANQIENPTSYNNVKKINDIVYARIETEKGCFRTAKVNLVVGATRLNSNFKLEYSVCDNKSVDSDDTNGISNFNFEDATSKILAQLPEGQSLQVSYYESEQDALSEQNPILDISNHRNSNSPKLQKIYVRVESEELNACLGLGHHINLNVLPLPEKQTISDYSLCSYTNQATFDLTLMDDKVKGAQKENLIITYHLTESAAENNITIPDPKSYTNTSNPQTIFVRAFFDTNNNQVQDEGECVRTDINFKLRVLNNPVIMQPNPITSCEDSMKAEFDLTQRENEITQGDQTISLTYYDTLEDLENDNPIPDPQAVISTQLKKTIYILASAQNGCTSKTSMDLEIILFENFNINPDPIEECEVDGDGLDPFDLTIRENQILNNLNTTKFEFTYYEDKDDAEQGNTNNIKTPKNFINTIKFRQTIYVRIKPKDNDCFRVVPLEIIVNQVPKIDIEDQYLLCFDNKDNLVTPTGQTTLELPPINTKLSSEEYDFQWYSGSKNEVENDPSSFIIQGATASIFNITSPGDYTVVATNKATLCRISASTVVLKSSPPEQITVDILQPEFSGMNRVKVNVTGSGDYEYALDDGPWQKDNILNNIHYGEHTIFVRDRYGCAIKSIKITIIDYPKYFTPNGDGYHDTWNISSLKSQANAKIYIFDRYGKLLKMITPASEGWDGTFNGKPMPTSDYWFIVEYQDSAQLKKEFRAHFTLKR